jgi:hypothetical protein
MKSSDVFSFEADVLKAENEKINNVKKIKRGLSRKSFGTQITQIL